MKPTEISPLRVWRGRYVLVGQKRQRTVFALELGWPL